MKILALGTNCVDVYPQKNIVMPGGEALNIAVQLSVREDTDIYLMGQIGNDAYSASILESIKGRRIDSRHLYQAEGETAHHVIHIDNHGDRYFEDGAWHGGVSDQFALSDPDRELLRDMDAVITTLWEPNMSELVALKTEKNYLLAVDFNDRRDFSRWEEHIDNLDIFFLSADESMQALFKARSAASDTLFVLTFAEHGSIVYHRGQVFQCPAVEVDHVVDTTGCGDCYQGHFVAEYLQTGNIQQAMQRASLEAAKVTAYIGGFPTRRSKVDNTW